MRDFYLLVSRGCDYKIKDWGYQFLKPDATNKDIKYSDEELLHQVLTGMSWLESHLRDFIQSTVSDADISFEQFLILYTLNHRTNHQITVKELAVNRHVSSSAISRKLTYLLTHDLIVLKIDEFDRRYRYLTLTSKGEAIANKIEKINIKRLSNFMDVFGRSQASDLNDQILKVYKVLVEVEKLDSK